MGGRGAAVSLLGGVFLQPVSQTPHACCTQLAFSYMWLRMMLGYGRRSELDMIMLFLEPIVSSWPVGLQALPKFCKPSFIWGFEDLPDQRLLGSQLQSIGVLGRRLGTWASKRIWIQLLPVPQVLVVLLIGVACLTSHATLCFSSAPALERETRWWQPWSHQFGPRWAVGPSSLPLGSWDSELRRMLVKLGIKPASVCQTGSCGKGGQASGRGWGSDQWR